MTTMLHPGKHIIQLTQGIEGPTCGLIPLGKFKCRSSQFCCKGSQRFVGAHIFATQAQLADL